MSKNYTSNTHDHPKYVSIEGKAKGSFNNKEQALKNKIGYISKKPSGRGNTPN